MSGNGNNEDLRSVIKKLEEVHLNTPRSGMSSDIPARIREIVTQSMSPTENEKEEASILVEENKKLKLELDSVEEKLSSIRHDRQRFTLNSPKLKLNQHLMDARPMEAPRVVSPPVASSGSLANDVGLQQVLLLKQKLEDEQADYRRKLQAYQDGQQRQAQLIQKLQNKVLQYKRKNAEQETVIDERANDVARLQSELQKAKAAVKSYEDRVKDTENEHNDDLESSLIQLEEERQRNASLQHVNNMLREQLEQATNANNQLTIELQKVTNDYTKAVEELEQRENDEEKYFTEEHEKILKLWAAINSFRRGFNEMKLETQKDLAQVKADINRSSRNIQSVTMSMEKHQKNTVNYTLLHEERKRREKTETLLREKVEEALELRAMCEQYKDEINAKQINESSQMGKLKEELSMKTTEAEVLKKRLQQMGIEHAEESEKWENDSQASMAAAREEADLHHQTLRELVNFVLDDAEATANILGLQSKVDRSFDEAEEEAEDGILNKRASSSPRQKVRMRSISPTRARSPAHSESALSAVKSAIKKRRLQIQELKNKFDVLQGEHKLLQKQVKDKAQKVVSLENELNRIGDNHRTCQTELEGALQTMRKFKQMCDVLKNEKENVEKSKQQMLAQIDDHQSKIDKLTTVNAESLRQKEHTEEEKNTAMKEKDRSMREIQKLKNLIADLEGKQSALKEELVDVKEKLNRAGLSKEVLEQEKAHLSELQAKSDSQKEGLEIELSKLRGDEVQLKDALVKLQSLNEALGQDKVDLNRIIQKVEVDRDTLSNEKQELDMEKSSIKEELLRTERERIELESEKMNLEQSLESAVQKNKQLQQQLQEITRTKSDINDSFNVTCREKDALHSDLQHCRKENERQAANLQRLSKEKEELTREKAHLTVQVTGFERSQKTLSEGNAALKSDKDALESAVYELQQALAKLETRKEQLEVENHQANLAREALTTDLNRLKKEREVETMKMQKEIDLLEQQLAQKSRDHEIGINRVKQQHIDELDKVAQANEKTKQKMMKESDITIDDLRDELEKLRLKSEQERNMLVHEVATTQKERDDLLLQAESEKQEELRVAANEKSVLLEKYNAVKDDAENLQLEMDKLRQECATKSAQEKAMLIETQQKLKMVSDELDERVEVYQAKVRELETNIIDLIRGKEKLITEQNELTLQMKLVEEGRDNLKYQYKQCLQQINESKDGHEASLKECGELKRLLKDAEMEKQVRWSSANELRELVKMTESEKTQYKQNLEESGKMMAQLEESNLNQLKEGEELRANIRELENTRQEARREIQQLHNQVRTLEGDCLKQKKELSNVKDQLAKSERLLEEGRSDLINNKQKLKDAENVRESHKRDIEQLNNKLSDINEELRIREKDYQMTIDDARKNEIKSFEKLKNLENLLDNANQEKSDLKLRLSSAEGRNAGLDSQLTKIESSKNEIEFKLNNVYSTLRRTLGLKLSPGVSPSKARSPSPTRPTGPKKRTPYARNRLSYNGDEIDERSPNSDSLDTPVKFDTTTEVDPEFIRASLRDFAQKLKDLERERDEGYAKVVGLERQVDNLEKDRSECEERLQILQKNLEDTEEGKRGVDGRLSSAQTALMLQEETIRRVERERKMLNEKLEVFERNLAQAEAEKRTLKEKLLKLQQDEGRSIQEREAMRSQIDNAESRVTRIDLKKRALEGDLERMRLQSQESENEKQSLKTRCEQLAKEKKELEQRTSALQLSLDRLNSTLSKSNEQERVFKEKVTELSISLNETNTSSQFLQEKLQDVQRALTNSGHEKQVLQEKYDALRMEHQASLRTIESMKENILLLKSTIAESESKRMDIEAELHQAQLVLQKKNSGEGDLIQKITKLQEEKRGLQDRLAQQQRVLSQIEQEKREVELTSLRIEKDRKSVKAALDKAEKEKYMVEEELGRARGEKSELDRTLITQNHDANELRSQVDVLQQALEDKEQLVTKKLADVNARHRDEIEREAERSRNAQLHLERTHATRERSHKQRVRGLEEQVNTLKEQLAKEMQQKQNFFNRASQKNEEIRDIRQRLTSSLNEVSKNAIPDVLERESNRLDETLEQHQSFAMKSSIATSTPFRRTKSASPVARISPEKYNALSGLTITPTTDPGMTSTRHATPLTTDSKKSVTQSFVSPIRKARKAR